MKNLETNPELIILIPGIKKNEALYDMNGKTLQQLRLKYSMVKANIEKYKQDRKSYSELNKKRRVVYVKQLKEALIEIGFRIDSLQEQEDIDEDQAWEWGQDQQDQDEQYMA